MVHYGSTASSYGAFRVMLTELHQETDSIKNIPLLINVDCNKLSYTYTHSFDNNQYKNIPLQFEEIYSDLLSDYISLPPNTNVIQSALSSLKSLSNSDLVQYAKKILLIIQENLNVFAKEETELLPPIRVFDVEDGSILIEWIFKDFRIGFNIESNINESGWYLVTNKNLGEINASAYILDGNIKKIILWLLYFVIIQNKQNCWD